MRRFWVVLVAVVVGLVVVAPRGGADVPYGFPNEIRWLDSLLEYADSLLVYAASAPVVETETFTVVTNLSTLVRADTLKFSFNASDFREVMFKFTADSLTSDSVTVFFLSGATGAWTAGNLAQFDRDPTTAALQGWTLSHGAAGAAIPVYGMAVSPTNINGAHIIGPFINGYIVLRNTAGVQCMTRRIKNLSVFAACKR